MFSPTICHIDHTALAHNMRQMGPPEKLMPVIKSNAYGHGLLPVAHTLARVGATHFAVGTVPEGRALREAGFGQEIVTLLGTTCAEEMAEARALALLPLVHSIETLRRAAACGTLQQPMRVVIKQETGMSRLGFSLAELPDLLEALRTMPQVQPAIFLSHFACADMPEKKDSVMVQAESFKHMYTALHDAYPPLRACLNNTAGIMGFPQLAYDISRPGIALYGCSPLAGTTWQNASPSLRPVMSVSTPILQVRDVPAGTPISYGETYITPKPTRIAVLAIGYADGFSRGMSGKGQVVIAGHRVPLLGRVCMGMCMADVGGLPTKGPDTANAVREGDTAWLLGGPEGQDDPAALSVQDIANHWGTIPYEVLCMLGTNTHKHLGYGIQPN